MREFRAFFRECVYSTSIRAAQNAAAIAAEFAHAKIVDMKE
jgi:hypothetical protein